MITNSRFSKEELFVTHKSNTKILLGIRKVTLKDRKIRKYKLDRINFMGSQYNVNFFIKRNINFVLIFNFSTIVLFRLIPFYLYNLQQQNIYLLKYI